MTNDVGEVGVLPGMEGAVDVVAEAQLRSEAARRIFEESEGSAPQGEAGSATGWATWMGEYWALVGEGWGWRQAVYMLWASQPRQGRWPKTQEALATEVLGLGSDRRIREWRANNPAMDVRVAKLAASALSKARAEVYEALIHAASNPDPRAHSDRRLALEMMGDYVPRQRVDVGAVAPEDMGDLSEAELAALAQDPSQRVSESASQPREKMRDLRRMSGAGVSGDG